MWKSMKSGTESNTTSRTREAIHPFRIGQFNLLGIAHDGGNVSIPNLPFFSNNLGYVFFVVSYLSVSLRCWI